MAGQTPVSLGSFAAAAVLLTAFVLVETRSSQPITPLWLLRDRSRSASYVARLLLVAGMFGSFFFLTQFVQEVLGLSLLKAASFVPMTAALFATSRLAPRLVAKFGSKAADDRRAAAGRCRDGRARPAGQAVPATCPVS